MGKENDLHKSWRETEKFINCEGKNGKNVTRKEKRLPEGGRPVKKGEDEEKGQAAKN